LVPTLLAPGRVLKAGGFLAGIANRDRQHGFFLGQRVGRDILPRSMKKDELATSINIKLGERWHSDRASSKERPPVVDPPITDPNASSSDDDMVELAVYR
jgi:hypothetical protein